MMEIPDAAKLWKRALQAEWPGVRWSVRSAPRGWFSVITAWEDGPTENAVAVFCRAFKTVYPDAASWVRDSSFRRTYSPAGYAVVIEAITRDIPTMPIPRTPDGGLDIRAARAQTWAGPVKVGGRFYGHKHVYDLVAVVELVAADHDYTPSRATESGGPDASTE
ncbi:LPD29 domain-containing protein [Nocardia sp. XZ_19_385]|uniref:LPD29 domain-containing protein n=1 Tax=Nocardia sp. XZ_19_385 TaxID=2769488 RepID=UPI00188EC16F|nr:LPD29 domain-containing protein [Nocardia sp. XZ_19_385]